jgi:hypothetical protein
VKQEARSNKPSVGVKLKTHHTKDKEEVINNNKKKKRTRHQETGVSEPMAPLLKASGKQE